MNSVIRGTSVEPPAKPKPRRLTKAERRANARRNIAALRDEWEAKQERLKQNQQL